jgi:hypothetical protein
MIPAKAFLPFGATVMMKLTDGQQTSLTSKESKQRYQRCPRHQPWRQHVLSYRLPKSAAPPTLETHLDLRAIRLEVPKQTYIQQETPTARDII